MRQDSVGGERIIDARHDVLSPTIILVRQPAGKYARGVIADGRGRKKEERKPLVIISVQL